MRYLFAILLFAVAGGLFFLYVGPAYGTVQSLQAQNAQDDQALAQAAKLDQTYQGLLSRYNSLDQNAVGRLQVLLPDQVNNIQLILDLSNLAQADGMPLQNVSVSAPQTTTSAANSPQAAVVGNTLPYGSYTLTFTTTGTYQQFQKFIQDLESSLRLIDLVSLSISSGQTAGVYQYSITVQTYWLK